MSSNDCFDVEKVSNLFKNSLFEDDDVILESYLQAYEEIMKFFQLMGSIFSFVSSDVRTKLDILYEFRNKGDTMDKFTSIKSMIVYEKETELFQDKNYVSGSRTLLRLHRGLEFVYEFLLRLQALNDEDKAHNCCKSAYNDTLAKHHPFLIRKGALLAMYAMPTKTELLHRVCKDVPKAIEVLPEMLNHTRLVYDRTHGVYETNCLLNLP